MPGAASVRDPWSSGDLNIPTNEPLQWRRGTFASLNSQNPLLAAGEPAWEIDTSQGKVGNGTTQYNSLPYTLGGSASTLTLNAGSIAANPTEVTGAAVSLDPFDARVLLEVPWIDTFDAVADTVDAHVVGAVKAPVLAGHTGTSTLGSATVTTTTDLPAHFIDSLPVYGPGVPKYTYIRNIAVDRRSFQLSSTVTPSAFVAAPAANGAPGGNPGTGAFTVRNPYSVAHGAWLGNLWDGNPVSSVVAGWSGPTLSIASLPIEKWMVQWVKGELWVKSNEFPTAERIFPSDPYTPILKHVQIPAIDVAHVWSSFPTSTPAAFKSHYIGYIPLEGATQAKIVVTWLVTSATLGSGAKIRAQYHNGTTWVDLAETANTIEVGLEALSATSKEGSWGVIDNLAISTAAGQGDRLLIRLVGFAASAAGSPAFSQIELWTKP